MTHSPLENALRTLYAAVLLEESASVEITRLCGRNLSQSLLVFRNSCISRFLLRPLGHLQIRYNLFLFRNHSIFDRSGARTILYAGNSAFRPVYVFLSSQPSSADTLFSSGNPLLKRGHAVYCSSIPNRSSLSSNTTLARTDTSRSIVTEQLLIAVGQHAVKLIGSHGLVIDGSSEYRTNKSQSSF